MIATWYFQCCSCCILVLIKIAFALECDPTKIEDDEQKRYECLVQTLFDPSKYSPLVRPVQNINETLNVEFSVQLSQIITLDEKNQVMKTNVWLQLYWRDYQLAWDKKGYEAYNDITVVRIRPDLIWRPDVVLFNNADGNYEVSYMSNCLVFKDGTVNWIPPAIYKSSCKIDVQYFPFDEQNCDLKFGSWTFLDHQLNFSFYKKVSHFDVSDYLTNGAWDIVEGDAEIKKTSTGKTNEFKAMVIFRLRLRRKTLFYTVNLIIPCVLISFVTLSVFILPADAGEKITLCISILLALVVFLLLISKILPPSLTIPLISQYLLFTFIMNILAIVSTVIVINRNYRTPRTHQMPYWVRLVFLNFLPRIMFMKRPDHDDRWNETSDDKGDTPPKRNINRDPDLTRTTHNCLPQAQPQPFSGGEIENLIETHHAHCRLNATSQQEEDSAGNMETSFINKALKPVSQEIYRAAESVKFIHRHLKKDDEYHTVIDDWRYVARVIDRLLFSIFFAVTAFGTLGIFMKAPHILETVDQNEILAEMNAAWDAVKSA
ncbi:acetylcholine receptor subunit beta-like 1 [Ruditapes philippinarum]|uniref:acetylcholine receptor subunit beta-like 1 n=1 Tax=Ruditapes philippinarum TaxID=129788 RepID=UPI00295B61A5|nr:acetylcholine receptor subunit beta-like 1 [Ruditapes philippinarum]